MDEDAHRRALSDAQAAAAASAMYHAVADRMTEVLEARGLEAPLSLCEGLRALPYETALRVERALEEGADLERAFETAAGTRWSDVDAALEARWGGPMPERGVLTAWWHGADAGTPVRVLGRFRDGGTAVYVVRRDDGGTFSAGFSDFETGCVAAHLVAPTDAGRS